MNIVVLAGLSLSLAAAGIFAAFAVGFASAAGARTDSVAPIAALYSSLVAAVAFLVTAQNFELIEPGQLADAIEFYLTLASGPLFFLLIIRLVGASPSIALAVLPAGMIALGHAVLGASFDIRAAVLVQIAYTFITAVTARGVAGPINWRSAPASIRIAAALLGTMGLVHLGQVIRMALAGFDSVRLLMPLVFALAAIGLLSVVIRRGRVLPSPAKSQVPPVLSLDELSAALENDPGIRQPAYRLDDLAAAARARPEDVSRLINAETGRGFIAFVNRERIRLACDLLACPDERDVSIDAVAMAVGFKSRSAFYRAFAAETGKSPGAYRKTRQFLS